MGVLWCKKRTFGFKVRAIIMQQYKGHHFNAEAYILENAVLRIVVLPELGGKIASLVYKPQGFEVFFQPVKKEYTMPNYGDEFALFDTSGSDEMFPTIDVCADPLDNTITWPDHGEIWALPWQCMFDEKGLYSRVQGVVWNYVFERRISINDNTVTLNYAITNKENLPLYGLWAFHGLVAVDEHTEIILPNVSKLINVHDSALLGKVGVEHDYPTSNTVNGDAIALDKIAPPSTGKSEKYYVSGPTPQGQCSLLLNRKQLEYQLVYNAHKLPYLGVWINEGGFKNEYNVALEPTNGFYDTNLLAAQNGMKPLKPNQTLTFTVHINLIPR